MLEQFIAVGVVVKDEVIDIDSDSYYICFVSEILLLATMPSVCTLAPGLRPDYAIEAP
jgi:hypothetical protein